MMKVMIIGSNGQLGQDLLKSLTEEGFLVMPLTHKELEVSDEGNVRDIISSHGPDVVINTAAFHKTDVCEEQPEKAFLVNALGALNVARTCSEIGATSVFISTDYVFDGKTDRPYTESDTPNPINVYGTSKLAGETFTKNYSPNHYIIRSSSLFGLAGSSGKGGNFVETIVSKVKKNEKIAVVDDIVMSPTYTYDLARIICRIIKEKAPYGVYHIANAGYCSWWEFASSIVQKLNAGINVERIKSTDFPSKARRPKFSALTTQTDFKMRSWKDALDSYLKAKGYL
jgi:dTDP-4-dehydrorhamnose reductase